MILNRKMKRDDCAVTSVIIALLFFGLIIILLVSIQTVYVPRWIEQDEGIHMHEIKDSFAKIKNTIDIQILSQNKIPVSTPITLGIEVNSFLTSTRSYGSLKILKNETSITFSNDTIEHSFILGSIKYFSSNNYYINQEYILEGGGLIINQKTGNIMLSHPQRVLNDGDFEIGFTFVNISDKDSTSSLSGFGIYSIQTNYSDTTYLNITNITSIVISTEYPNAWKLFLKKTLTDLELTEGNGFEIDVANDSVIVNIDEEMNVDSYIEIVKIFSQIGSGRIN